MCAHWLGDIDFDLRTLAKGRRHQLCPIIIGCCLCLNRQMMFAKVRRHRPMKERNKYGVRVLSRWHRSCPARIRHSLCTCGERHLQMESQTTKDFKHNLWRLRIARATSFLACEHRPTSDDISQDMWKSNVECVHWLSDISRGMWTSSFHIGNGLQTLVRQHRPMKDNIITVAHALTCPAHR